MLPCRLLLLFPWYLCSLFLWENCFFLAPCTCGLIEASPNLSKKMAIWSRSKLISIFRDGKRVSHSVVSDSLGPHGLYVVHQAPLSMGFPRQEYWSGLPFPPPGILPTQGLNHGLLCLLHWRADSFTTETFGKQCLVLGKHQLFSFLW